MFEEHLELPECWRERWFNVIRWQKKAPLFPIFSCFVFFSLNEKSLTTLSGGTEAHVRQGDGMRNLNMVKTQVTNRDTYRFEAGSTQPGRL